MSDTLQDRTQSVSASGEEELRFIRNFHDVFLSIGLGMLIVGIGIASSLIVGNMVLSFLGEGFSQAPRRALLTGATVCFIDAAIVWALAEVFARTRRLFLPAIVIMIGFVFFFVTGVGLGYAGLQNITELNDSVWEEAGFRIRMLIFLLAVAGTVASAAYYTRMKLPFAMGITGAAMAATVITGLGLFIPDLLTDNLLLVLLFEGLFLFTLGVFFDARDPARVTRLSDNGFWLHFFAAPLIFFSVTRMAAGGGTGDIFAGSAAGAPIMTLVVVLVFALISLLINRRALLVAGLISALVAVSSLLRDAQVDAGWTAASTLLILGGAMVALGGGWHTLRGVLVAPFPKSGFLARIIPPETGPNPRDQIVG